MQTVPVEQDDCCKEYTTVAPRKGSHVSLEKTECHRKQHLGCSKLKGTFLGRQTARGRRSWQSETPGQSNSEWLGLGGK